MSQQPHLPKPATAADCDDVWIAVRRGIIQRDGHAVRKGSGAWIEVQSINCPEQWGALTLPGNTVRFASVHDRDVVLERLIGKSRELTDSVQNPKS